jgi:hypothetical protein
LAKLAFGALPRLDIAPTRCDSGDTLQGELRPLPDDQRDSHDFATLEPDVLDADMTPADLVYTLRYLHFDRSGMSTLRLDREVVRYLIRRLKTLKTWGKNPPVICHRSTTKGVDKDLAKATRKAARQ